MKRKRKSGRRKWLETTKAWRAARKEYYAARRSAVVWLTEEEMAQVDEFAHRVNQPKYSALAALVLNGLKAVDEKYRWQKWNAGNFPGAPEERPPDNYVPPPPKYLFDD